MLEPRVIASLEPGKLYVIKVNARFRSMEDFEKFHADLKRHAPECRFLILEKDVDIVEGIPKQEVPR